MDTEGLVRVLKVVLEAALRVGAAHGNGRRREHGRVVAVQEPELSDGGAADHPADVGARRHLGLPRQIPGAVVGVVHAVLATRSDGGCSGNTGQGVGGGAEVLVEAAAVPLSVAGVRVVGRGLPHEAAAVQAHREGRLDGLDVVSGRCDLVGLVTVAGPEDDEAVHDRR